MGMKSLVFGYLVLTHVLLYASSPYYRHEVSRAFKAGSRAWETTAGALTGRGSNATEANVAASLPKSGVYASTELLQVIQEHMTLQGSKAAGNSSTAVYSSGDQLLAYMTATDVLHGEGWKARSAFFVFLLAPRYILTALGGLFGSKFVPELNLFHLASAELPAVGLLRRSEVSHRVGRWCLFCVSRSGVTISTCTAYCAIWCAM